MILLIHTRKVFEKTKIKKSITSLFGRLYIRKWHGSITIIFVIYCFHTFVSVIIHSLENSFSLLFTRESITRHLSYLQPSLYITLILCLLNYFIILLNHSDHPYTSMKSTRNLGSHFAKFFLKKNSKSILNFFLGFFDFWEKKIQDRLGIFFRFFWKSNSKISKRSDE